jgi:hypothetical protein
MKARLSQLGKWSQPPRPIGNNTKTCVNREPIANSKARSIKFIILTPYNFGYESIACGRNPSGTSERDLTGIVLIDIRKRSLEVLNK